MAVFLLGLRIPDRRNYRRHKGLMMSYFFYDDGLAAASATIYIMWRGYQTLAGKLSTPMEDTMWTS
ncbi:type IV secretion system VirB6 component [Klebsiella pneumoniae]|uniref:Type IV secretion system VirB6 component n=1 Tax=Klebsiella pneumoniae TaxID=573 RepID=A0A378ARU9_KLEPN|nr:type IV secretion system VirB6 component [Klebsiella pneumoniae]